MSATYEIKPMSLAGHWDEFQDAVLIKSGFIEHQETPEDSADAICFARRLFYAGALAFAHLIAEASEEPLIAGRVIDHARQELEDYKAEMMAWARGED